MKELDLRGNAIGEAGATQLADALGTNTSVKELYLNDNSIGEAGATQLADALGTNTSVEVLYLTNNSIGEAGATQLADALGTNTSVEQLDLRGNSSGEELEGRIEALLAPAARAQRKAEATGGGAASAAAAAAAAAAVAGRQPPLAPAAQPRWAEASACLLCGAEFGVLMPRRHHCRQCGKSVCDDCSPGRAALPGLPGQQRVCRRCEHPASSAALLSAGAQSQVK